MAAKSKRCKYCGDYFQWDDDVIQIANDYYHKDCVTLYPTGYCAFIGDEYIGETENGEGEMACGALSENEYIDLDEQEEE